jgi:hypothetical protein
MIPGRTEGADFEESEWLPARAADSWSHWGLNRTVGGTFVCSMLSWIRDYPLVGGSGLGPV